MKLEYAISALREMASLEKAVSRRIMDKMQWFASQKDPLSFAKPLKNSVYGSYRFRVGDYRVFVDIKRDHISILYVLSVKNRKDAY